MADMAVDWRSATASLGLGLTTTSAFATIPFGSKVIHITPTTFSTAVVARVAFCPELVVLRTNDALATVTDESRVAQDGSGSTTVTLSSLPTKALGGYLLVGSARRFRGVRVDMNAAVNGTASVLLVEYWNGTAWATISATDGSASGGATFAVDGNVTWTVPSTLWRRANLQTIGATTAITLSTLPPARRSGASLFWTRWSVSAALDSSTLVDAMLGLAESAAYAELVTGVRLECSGDGVAAIEALTDAGTAKLIVNCGAGAGGFD